MSRRGLAAVAIAVGAALVLAVVAFVAYNAGARSGGYEIGRMRGPGFSMGMGGWFGGGIGLLLLILIVAGIVWAVVALARPEPHQPPPPPGFGAQQPPPPGFGAPPQPPQAPQAPPPAPTAPAAPAPGSVEAFEAWHRRAHAAQESATPGDATREGEPPTG